MKKFSLTIAAAATLAALSAAPASAENTVTEQSALLNSLLNNQTVVSTTPQVRATTFTNRAPKANRYETAKDRLFKNRPPRGR